MKPLVAITWFIVASMAHADERIAVNAVTYDLKTHKAAIQDTQSGAGASDGDKPSN